MSGKTAAIVAFVVVGVASLVPEVGLFGLGPLAALVIGAVAGYQAASSSGSSGVRAGVTAGIGALIGTTLFVAVASLILGGDAAIQDFVRASEPNPEARVPYEWIQPLAAVLGIFVGLVVGVVNLIASAIGGFVATLIAPSRASSY
jgi:hypothetical protein